MNDTFWPAALKLLAPLAAIGFVLLASRRRRLSLDEDLGFRAVTARTLIAWGSLWAVWLAASEVVIRTFRLDQAAAWPDSSPIAVMARVAAIGVLGPVAEELLARGLVLRLLTPRLGRAGAVIVTACGWAALHVRYGAGTLALVTVDGVIFGAARVVSGSLWTPIALHVAGNLISIGQSLWPR